MKALVALGLTSCLVLAGCTVQPLYGGLTSSIAEYREAAPELAAVYISQPSDRSHQLVRNELAFMLYGGAAQPTEPRYHLDFSVTTTVQGAARIPATASVSERLDRPTSSILTMNALYSVVNVHTGEQITVGRAQTMANFDLSGQEFARVRAEREAEARAARELAAIIGLNVAAKLRTTAVN
ncbi:hypothetical protein GRZ55_11530 [Chelativorans sp. ZYF759]|uniref:hypothetical protein n=1 Tax=Chelativorans sp. ZYF759 TaxID=2692213 RepID=UPI00145FB614|nr:hypothetical protein [Chelativorans sp. ZYF759]NMG39874.1 hypothetical protein [Chelativorans sp. ZYF759]